MAEGLPGQLEAMKAVAEELAVEPMEAREAACGASRACGDTRTVEAQVDVKLGGTRACSKDAVEPGQQKVEHYSIGDDASEQGQHGPHLFQFNEESGVNGNPMNSEAAKAQAIDWRRLHTFSHQLMLC